MRLSLCVCVCVNLARLPTQVKLKKKLSNTRAEQGVAPGLTDTTISSIEQVEDISNTVGKK